MRCVPSGAAAPAAATAAATTTPPLTPTPPTPPTTPPTAPDVAGLTGVIAPPITGDHAATGGIAPPITGAANWTFGRRQEAPAAPGGAVQVDPKLTLHDFDA